ncbi:PREDICTED: protein STRUBBELIG-RECEPTOR FAMILY 3-like isoform X1 [Lupinus angustifolius]|uniref:protein STRUBBELIG-RECEPTOR FAMILY 3-like isoform X1 n=1 Tax=Lupinus angustifolius TaxID=3871 RepID=UPI00092E4AA8|nr:PREDICTED: protein STRUBBELIG-RECEPTOR FAMILY 3-like isoform X1 [Lupinus angustifolius]XP_019424812.1 PREDICTED: protein STRUBBELIG-RECEPTOR FAMILY 3-like isoform X1 [Lupinus angustifolius]XP_019424813.1 PREDICTED: protein STRUBBELIG-RECEPTOR FAMILY 3-like isoform X1 [Lupinus angustifolius]
MGSKNLVLHVRIFVMSMLILTGTFCVGDTDIVDVEAINNLYIALGAPPLKGWKPVGGDPCFEAWQGVACVLSRITAINLPSMNLNGELGSNLNFPSIIQIDLSNNHIGGLIPFNLPRTLITLSLSGNRLNGSIPDGFSSLPQLTSLDLSSNNLSGQLPSSLRILSSLTTLQLQNNQLSGKLDVLQNLPLRDLNIENNLFSGPIPPKLLTIPNFRKVGNPFNTTIIPPPPATAHSPVATAPSSSGSPQKAPTSPSTTETTLASILKSFIAENVIWIVGAGVLILIAIGACLLMFWCFKRRSVKKHDAVFEASSQEENADEKPSPVHEVPNRKTNSILKVRDGQEISVKIASTTSESNARVDSKFPPLQPPPNPIPTIPAKKVVFDPAIPTSATEGDAMTSNVKVYTVALLQQYTNSFSQENFIGKGTLGPVYRAELLDGKLLAVRKLDATASVGQNHEQFLQTVSSISKIQHSNIVQFLGYCDEYNQRLLVYEYCSNGTLYDALHGDDECRIELPWNARIRVALGIARALEYLHETFRPPIVHRNFKSANVLLNDNLEVRVSDCGLDPILSSGHAGQMSGRLLTAFGYSAPEFESGTYTQQSDVFSFGVVMLELLTGRKSFDKTRPRGEQILVRWAVPQLHDIDTLSKMVDPNLKGAYPMKSLSRLADIVSSCVQHEPEFRPAMSEIVQDLGRMM